MSSKDGKRVSYRPTSDSQNSPNRPKGGLINITGSQLVFGFRSTALILLLNGLCCILVGYLLQDAKNNVTTISKRYDNLNCDRDIDGDMPGRCNVIFNATEESFKAPITLYYELRGFWDSRRRYLNSRSDEQLKNKKLDPKDAGKMTETISNCDTLGTHEGKKLYPCGLIASSFFSDRFVGKIMGDDITPKNLCPSCVPQPINKTDPWTDKWWDRNTWTSEGLVWEKDKSKFNRPSNLSDEFTRVGPFQKPFEMPWATDDDLILWYRNSKSSNFKKPYRRLGDDTEILKGQSLVVEIYSWFNVNRDGASIEKYLVLMGQLGTFGEGSDTLMLIFYVTGGILLATLLFFVVISFPFCDNFFPEVRVDHVLSHDEKKELERQRLRDGI